MLAERASAGDEILRRQLHELHMRQLLDVTDAETQRLRVQRLLEQRARKARVAK
jgi:hypothetical protein